MVSKRMIKGHATIWYIKQADDKVMLYSSTVRISVLRLLLKKDEIGNLALMQIQNITAVKPILPNLI
jgi:hypothetical protein